MIFTANIGKLLFLYKTAFYEVALGRCKTDTYYFLGLTVCE